MSERDDIARLIRGVEAARKLLSAYIEPGPRDAVKTVDGLLNELDDQSFVAALDRLNRRKVIRLVDLS